MVMWFNVREAYDYLTSNGFVFTLRPKERREGKEPLMSSFNTPAFTGKHVHVKRIGIIKKVDREKSLKDYYKYSGFGSINEWVEKAGDSEYLYLVEMMSSLKIYVADATPASKSTTKYCSELEMMGNKVYLPERDIDSEDCGEIVRLKKRAISMADEVHVIFNGMAGAGLIDVGLAMAAGKTIIAISEGAVVDSVYGKVILAVSSSLKQI